MSVSTSNTLAPQPASGRYAGWLTAALLGLAVAGVVAAALTNAGAQVIFHVLLFLAGGGVIYISARRSPDCPILLQAYGLAYLVRLGAIFIAHFASPTGLYFIDDVTYHLQGSTIATSVPVSDLGNLDRYLLTAHTAYPLLVSFLYRAFGPALLSAKLLNAVAGALVAPVVYWLTFELTADRRIARTALWIAAFFLYDIAWSMFLMRDTILLLVFTFSLAAAIHAARHRSFSMLLALTGCLYLLSKFRFYAVTTWAAALVLACLAWFAWRWAPAVPRRRWILFGGAILALLLVLAFTWTILAQRITAIGNLVIAAEMFRGHDVYQLLVPAPSLGYVIELARGSIVYSFGPTAWIFWDIDPMGLIFYPGMYLVYALLPFFLIGFWRLSRELRPAAVFVLAPLLLHALVEIHLYQGGERQRMMMDALFILCAAVGWHSRSEYPRAVRYIYVAFAVLVIGHLAAHFGRYSL